MKYMNLVYFAMRFIFYYYSKTEYENDVFEKIENFKISDFINMNEERSVYKKVYEYKIKIIRNEEENEKETKLNKLESFTYFYINFTSLTKYKFSFYFTDELFERIRDVKFNYIIDNEYFDEFYEVNNYQLIINQSIIKILSPNSQNFNIKYTLLDRNSFIEKRKENKTQVLVPFFMIFYFIPCVCNLLVLLVIEKESKIKESLIIIGLKKTAFWISWAITYGFIIFLSSAIVTTVMIFCELFTYIHWTNTVGVMINALFFGMFILETYLEKDPKFYNVFLFVASPISFISLFNLFIKYDQQRIHINLINIFKKPSLSYCFFGLIFTCIFYFIVAIYLDNVLPQGSNFHKKWHFFITEFFKTKKNQMKDSRKREVNPYIQKVPENMVKTVEIQNINKIFKVKGKKKEILKNIDFKAYYNEIFAILGHNGAGKTTLMSIMTGILAPADGEVYYDNVPITNNEMKIYIDLLNKKNNFPKELSGGQRRKLCISLALLGSPKYVFLDEPTTGLDPYSRKNIWELLSSKKEGPDLLADRKMIISNGKISCLGTSIFLKQQFNMSYSFDIHCEDTSDSLITDNIVDKFCPGISKSKTISKTYVTNENSNNIDENKHEGYIISYSLPMKYSGIFKNVFEGINEVKKDHHYTIKNFSLTAPTLEELFINLENCNESNLQYQKATDKATIDIDSIFNKDTINKPSSFRQILFIIKLRLKIFLRNKTFAFIYTLLLVLLSIVSIYLVNLYINKLQSNEPTIFQSLNISPSIYENEKWFKEANLIIPALDYINKIESANKLNIDTISYAKDISISSGKDTSKLNYVGGLYGYSNNNDDNDLQFIIYKNISDSFGIPIAINLLSNAILEQNNINERFSVDLQPLNIYHEYYDNNDKERLFNVKPEMEKAEMEPLLIAGISLCISLCISVFGPYTVKEREEGITHQLFLNGTKSINYWLGVIISDSICIFIPIAIITFVRYLNNISIFHPKIIVFTLTMSAAWILGCLLHQYIISYFFTKYDKVSTTIMIINPIISLIVGMTIVTLSARGHLVFMEEIDNIKDEKKRLELKNAKIKLYIIYAVLILLVPGMIILHYDVFNCRDKFIVLIIMFIAIIIIYGTALFLLEKLKQKRIRKNMEYSMEERIAKDKIIENGPIDVRNEWRRIRQSINNYKESESTLNVFELNKDFKISSKDIKKKNKKKVKENENFVGREENEERKMKDINKFKKDITAFEKMDNRLFYDQKKKRYVNRVVDDVTFGVNTGECLGLLGPNGAGKTTTISMITGLLSHTHGDIKYGRKDLNETDMADLSLGYCSQHDALWELLTVKETIEFYLNICGYPSKVIPRYTKVLIDACGIGIHTHKKVCEISGGTKRKLSLIISICSLPKYIILDEPSAGMDPFTRRYMWKLISELKNICETDTILTTHSTEEAEALCDRIAILIKGRLVCINTPRSIKMNHSNTYILEVYTSYFEKFEEQYIKEQNLFGLSSREHYEKESSINYQKVFSLMEDAKEKQIINQYNFGQYTLEEVFINFVNKVD
ncbi:hypothetical protein U3516DRAFT_806105 [Neocallimastix sp. 'constans']